MEYPYYSPGGRTKKYAEGIIPIIILILIAMVLIGKTTNFFCGLPLLGNIFCGAGIINIAVIGDLQAIGVNEPTVLNATRLKTDVLDSYLGTSYNMYYVKYDPDLLVYARDALLRNYDIVILAGDRNFSRPVKDAIGWYVNNGGKLVVIGDAGVRDPDDPLYVGWGGGMFDIFPVRLTYTTNIDSPINLADPELNFVDINHPIVIGYQPRLNLSEVACTNIKAIEVTPTGGGIIAILSDSKDVPGIVESGTLFGGKVVYFAYDPGCTPNLWISTVGWLTGKI